MKRLTFQQAYAYKKRNITAIKIKHEDGAMYFTNIQSGRSVFTACDQLDLWIREQAKRMEGSVLNVAATLFCSGEDGAVEGWTVLRFYLTSYDVSDPLKIYEKRLYSAALQQEDQPDILDLLALDNLSEPLTDDDTELLSSYYQEARNEPN